LFIASPPFFPGVQLKSQIRHSRVELLERRFLLSSASLPRPDHVVVLIEEDHSYAELFGPPPAGALQTWSTVTPGQETWDAHLRSFEQESASFTHARSVGSTNAVDYQALFSGLRPIGDAPISPTAPNIASELNAAGLSFGGFAEDLPSIGYTGGSVGDYSTTHNPWLPFSNFPPRSAKPFENFPDDKWSALPTVAYVIPNQVDNMHGGTVNTADEWFHANIEPYADWAKTHNSMLIVTWDESHQVGDSIPTLVYGPMVKPGKYSQPITQDNILRTIEDMYGLSPTGKAADAAPLSQIFRTDTATSPSKAKVAHQPSPHLSTEAVQRRSSLLDHRAEDRD